MKITLNLEGADSSIEFDPVLSTENLGTCIKDLMQILPELLVHVYSNIPLLRPACKTESDSHVYVFRDGEEGYAENKLYLTRNALYNNLSSVISAALSTAFPDIEYINSCKAYAQDYCATHTEEENEEFLKEVTEVTEYVRTNFDAIIKELFEEETNDEVQTQSV